MDYFGDEETKKRWTESRCTHIFKSGNKCGTNCHLKKKNGYDKCYAHLSRYDKIDYDIAKGTEPSLIEARIARKVDKARYSVRKCRYEKKHGELPEDLEMPDMIENIDPRLTHRGRPFENKPKPIKIKKEKPPPPPPPAKEQDEELLNARRLCLEKHMDALIKVASKECGKVFRKKLYNKIIACCEEGIVVPDDLWYRYNSTFITQKERRAIQPFYELFQPIPPAVIE